ncbi:MAG: DUF5615 family PIN-like protein [Chloroflexaceae bacterium]|nr:DUF5615 family PIN-like protein [Chloroflexaceae bacterium]
MRYLLDEHIPPVYRTQLLRTEPGLTVWTIGSPGAPPLGTPDPEILEWCEVHGFVLVTNNRKSMPNHLADHLVRGRHVPGILVIDLDIGIGAMIAELALIAGASSEDEYQDMMVYLPIT